MISPCVAALTPHLAGMSMAQSDKQPNTGDAKQDLKQSCASEALETADALLGHRSRYKPEVSFDMTADPPRPFMHRDAAGQDTTRRSEYWLGRAKNEIKTTPAAAGRCAGPT